MPTPSPAATSAGLSSCPGVVYMVTLDGDLDTLTWTTRQAAEAAGVTPDVIYQWKRRGKLTPVNPRGRPRYRALDVLTVEAATRARAHRVHTAA